MNRTSKLESWAMPFLMALTAIIYIGSTGIPALLDDADSFYAEALIGVMLFGIAVSVSSGAANGFLGFFTGSCDGSGRSAYYFGHLFDLTPESLLALRRALLIAAIGLGIVLPLHCFLKSLESKAATLALGMLIFFIAADAGFLTFAPRLTSKPIATEINRRLDARSIIVIDGEYEEECSIGFYTGHTVLIHNAPSSNLEYGSRFADAPPLFVDDEGLRELWNKPFQARIPGHLPCKTEATGGRAFSFEIHPGRIRRQNTPFESSRSQVIEGSSATKSPLIAARSQSKD